MRTSLSVLRKKYEHQSALIAGVNEVLEGALQALTAATQEELSAGLSRVLVQFSKLDDIGEDVEVRGLYKTERLSVNFTANGIAWNSSAFNLRTGPQGMIPLSVEESVNILTDTERIPASTANRRRAVIELLPHLYEKAAMVQPIRLDLDDDSTF